VRRLVTANAIQGGERSVDLNEAGFEILMLLVLAWTA
jgi:hypothetical protein